jgi:DNA repair exonuclease SbcCD ATPase subunit
VILFKSASWKNFLASGNIPTVIKLDQASTTLVLGVNGSGKSTLLDAICFGLYKKPFRKIKLEQIVNTINNADCEVVVEFEIGTKQYKVTRTLKPAAMELLIDGKPRPQEAATKDDQAFLEQDILKVDYDSFTQVVILGNAKYLPFMQLPAGKRREFIETILDIGVFSTMNEILKEKMDDVKDDLKTNGTSVISIKEQIALIQGFIAKLEAEQKKAAQETENQITELQVQIEERVTATDALKLELVSLQATVQESVIVEEDRDAHQKEKQDIMAAVQTDVKLLDADKKKIKSDIEKANKVLSFYNNTLVCDTCGQEINASHRTGIISSTQTEIDDYEKKIEKLDTDRIRIIENGKQSCKNIDEKLATLTPRLEEAAKQKKDLEKLRMTLSERANEKKNLETRIDMCRQLLERKPSGNIEEQTKKLTDSHAKLVRLEGQKKEHLETQQFYIAAGVMLKDSGIKAAIIRQYLPAINKLVNKYLAALDFFVSFSLDESFDETFKARHRDTLQYNSFSQGEKLRIDLALLFAWREIARQKNSCATNLLILDEVIDGSMDANGTDLFIKLLNDNLQGSNVFVISHKNDAALDKFRATLRFARDKNFSKLIEEL